MIYKILQLIISTIIKEYPHETQSRVSAVLNVILMCVKCYFNETFCISFHFFICKPFTEIKTIYEDLLFVFHLSTVRYMSFRRGAFFRL